MQFLQKIKKAIRLRIIWLVNLTMLSLIVPAVSAGESTGSISGTIIDKSTLQPLSGVSIIVTGTKSGTATDISGYFRIGNLPPGNYKVIVSMIGYKSDTSLVIVNSLKIIELNIALESKAISLPAVVVSGERLAERSCVSDHAMDRKSVLMRQGQMQDPIRVLQTLPGITSLGDLFIPSQIYVRGGGPEENLFLLDWTKVHWPWYFGGTKSVFNSEIIDKVELLTGGFPVKYGECLSSVLNVTTREGNREHLCGNLSLGLINTQGVIEGPMTSRGFFLVSGRRSYLDLIMDKIEEYPIPAFYDFNFKFGYEPWSGQKVSFSGMVTNEKIDFLDSDPGPSIVRKLYDSGKLNTQSLEWKSIISDKLYSLSVFTREKIDFEVEMGWFEELDISALDLGFRQDLTWELSPAHEIKSGFEFGYTKYDLKEKLPFSVYYFDPVVDPNDPATPLVDYRVNEKVKRGGFYLQDSWKPAEKFSLSGGLRFDYLSYNKNTDFSPRVALSYQLNNTTMLRTAWGYYCQNPEVEYISRERGLESKKAIHYILGLTKRFNQNWAGWIELYQKIYKDLVTVDSLEHYSNDGKGYSRGLELFLEKQKGSLNGWLSYSFGLAKRKEFLNKMESYSDFDQRHIASVVLDWNFSRRFTLDLQFRYASGRPYTPTIRFESHKIGDRWVWVSINEDTNSKRYPPFHQLNLRLQYECSIFGLKSSLFLEVWNLYNRKNIIYYDYDPSLGSENYMKKKVFHYTPFLPSLGFKFEF